MHAIRVDNLVHSVCVQDLKLTRLPNEAYTYAISKNTGFRSARIRALAEVPTPTAISFTPAESNLSFVSLKTMDGSGSGSGRVSAGFGFAGFGVGF